MTQVPPWGNLLRPAFPSGHVRNTSPHSVSVITETFRLAIWRYRTRGGRLYRLALDHDLSPSVLSATLTGARRCAYDPRIVAIGVALGLHADDVFVDDDEQAAAS